MLPGSLFVMSATNDSMVAAEGDGNTFSGGSLSSLVNNRVSVTTQGGGACPRKKGFVFVSESTGQVVAASCGVNSCEVCGWRKAIATAVAVEMAGPERFFTLTGVHDPAVVRNRLRQFRHRIRKRGYRWEDWSVIEANPRGTGFHVHGYQWGDYVPQPVVSKVARSVGFGVVADIRRWRRLGEGSGVAYAVKVATAYGVKAAAGDGLHRFLEVNGGRFGMWSRDFFRRPYRAALELALGRVDRKGHDPGPWVLRGTAGGIYVQS